VFLLRWGDLSRLRLSLISYTQKEAEDLLVIGSVVSGRDWKGEVKCQGSTKSQRWYIDAKSKTGRDAEVV